MPDADTTATEETTLSPNSTKKKAAKSTNKKAPNKSTKPDVDAISEAVDNALADRTVVLGEKVGEVVDEAVDTAILSRTAITNNQIGCWFTHHAPDAEQIAKYKQLREAGGALAQIIKNLTPNGEDQKAAIRKVREAIMTANAAIACRGR